MLVIVVKLALVLGAVVALGRWLRAPCARLGQPPVVGEMLAGILLGPSCLGAVAPSGSAWLLPQAVTTALGSMATLGVVVYMFLVGLELDLASIRRDLRSTAALALAGIALSFALGAGLVVAMPDVFATSAPLGRVAWFVGGAFAMTAFPVLARLLADAGLTGTPLGTRALACAAVVDIVVWVLVAIVTGVVERRVGVVVAFLIGLAMSPAARPLSWLSARLQPPVAWVLMPAFFAVSGLRTDLGLVYSVDGWAACMAIIIVAVLGKLGGTALAARLAGGSWREAGRLGLLLNVRGLMLIVVLNMGVEIGLVSPRAYTMMVVMALVTTMMAMPGLRWLGVERAR